MEYGRLQRAMNYVKAKRSGIKRYGTNDVLDFSVSEMLDAIEVGHSRKEECMKTLIENIPRAYMEELARIRNRPGITEALGRYPIKDSTIA